MPPSEIGTGGFLHDEKGKLSMSRALLLTQLVVVNVAGVVEGGDWLTLPGEWWALQAGLLIALVAWAGGRAGLQYLGPQVAGVVRAVASVKKAAGRKTPEHDEEDLEWVASKKPSS